MFSEKLNRLFGMLFLLTFGIIIITLFFYPVDGYHKATAAAAILIISVIFFYRLLNNKTADYNRQKLDKIFFILLILLFIIQLIAGYLLRFNAKTDLGSVNAMAVSFAETGDFSSIYSNNAMVNNGYLARFPNNNGIFLLLSVLYRIIYLISGSTPLYAPIVLNVIALNISVLFLYKTAKKIFSPQTAFFAGILSLFFTPVYTYTPYFYTDSLSMPFAVMSVYFFISSLETDKRPAKYAKLVLSSLLILLGFELKGSVAILLAGFFIYTCLSSLPLKKTLAYMGTILSAFLVFLMLFNIMVSNLDFTTDEELYENRYPMTHWVMMGLNGIGTFNQDDATFTWNSGNYDEKKAANIEEIKNRVTNLGPAGLISHLYNKARWTWGDGTYYITYHLVHGPVSENFLHEFFLKKGRFYLLFNLYSQGFQLMVLVFIFISVCKSIKKPKVDYVSLLRYLTYGIFLFLLIWETRSRYLVNFTPFFLLMAADGIMTASELKFSLARSRRSQAD